MGWSSDGRFVWAMDTVSEIEKYRLRLFEIATGEERLISDNLIFDGCSPPLSWSPDGQTLAFLTNLDSAYELNLLHLAEETSQTISVRGKEFYWSSDSHYLFVGDRLIDATTGSEFTAIQPLNGTFSPDGRYFAYKIPQSRNIQIYELETGVTNPMEITGNIADWLGSRYLIIQTDATEMSYAYYDVQTQALYELTIESAARLAALAPNAAFLYFRRNLPDNAGEELLRYKMETGEVSTIFESSGWIGSIIQREDWLVIRYNPDPPEPFTPTTFVRIMNADFSQDEALSIGWNYFSSAPQIAWSSDGAWLSIHADSQIYRFDPEIRSIELLPIESSNYIKTPFWSPDGQYLAALAGEELHIWDRRNDMLEPLAQQVGTLIGWQRGDTQDSLLYCGEG